MANDAGDEGMILSEERSREGLRHLDSRMASYVIDCDFIRLGTLNQITYTGYEIGNVC